MVASNAQELAAAVKKNRKSPVTYQTSGRRERFGRRSRDRNPRFAYRFGESSLWPRVSKTTIITTESGASKSSALTSTTIT
jgi:hypothetical protein